MRVFSCLATLALGSLVIAQSPLTTTFTGANLGNAGGAIFFDLTINTTVTIHQIDFNSASAAGTAGSLNVYLGPPTWVGNTANSALWTLIASGTCTTAGVGLPTPCSLTSPFALGPGTYGVGLVASSTIQHGYTTGAVSASTSEMSLVGGGAQNTPWSTTLFQPRGFNGSIYYTLGGTPIAVASQSPYGSGCYGYYTSFYEFFPNTSAGFDLSNSAMTLSLNGPAYNVTSGGGAFVTPTSPDLAPGNDGISVQPLTFPILYPAGGTIQVATQLEICSNGYVSPAGTNGTTATPAVAAFLGGAPRWCNWHDFDPSQAGASVHFDVDTANAAYYVTWMNCPDFNITGSQLSTWQLALFASGNVEFRWQTMSLSGGGGWPTLVGWTPGGGALDAGNRDLSATFPFSTQPVDNAPLLLDMSGRPLLGTSPNMVTGQIPTGTALGAVIFSFTQHDPGLSLAPFGMAGCSQFVGLDTTVIAPMAAPSANLAFAIPSTTTLNGVLIYAQSATFSPGLNPLGVITSNGLRMRVGSL
jgi:hypothetical protein